MDALTLAAELVAKWEGYRPWPYPDPASPLYAATGQHRARWGRVPARGIMDTLAPEVRALSGKPWTVGFGTTGPNIGPDSPGWSIPLAKANLEGDLETRWDRIKPHLRVTLAPHEAAACLSLAYNIGVRAFLGSTLMRLLNANERQDAADQFKRWNRAGGRVLSGLTARRDDERVMFLGLHPLLRTA